ncbi:MAG TPA: formylmethanofuran dehydrogenase subunit C [Gemmatimonadaceae bacterium]|jgi:formylmethanofuran dehydrogenase subunit C
MSNAVTLTLRAPIERVIEAESVVPDLFATLGNREIAELPVWDGRQRLTLGDLFQVQGEHASTVRVEGDVSLVDALGAAMTAGELTVEGNVGRYAGSRMKGGVLRVLGNAGYGAGLEMEGGLLDIFGDAGDRVGAARLGESKGMLGGEIIVHGRVGAEAGSRMRRGTIVCAAAGQRAGEAMIAGNVIVLGDAGEDVGRNNKRGTILVLGGVSIPPTYRYDCTYRPPHVALTLTHLRARHALSIDDTYITGRYRRHSGDLAELGKGEILEWTMQA